MAQEIKAKVSDIFNLVVKSEVVQDKTGGRQIITVVRFKCHAGLKEFDQCLLALQEKHQLDVMVSSPQFVMEVVGDNEGPSIEEQLGLD